VCVYGSTEAEPIAEIEAADISAEDRRAMREGNGLLAGVPVGAARVRIHDGEIVVAGPHVNEGYLDATRNAETKLLEDGTVWHRTGDAGRIDEQGRLWLLGRYGETCQTDFGELYPFVVETSMRFVPGVTRAALCQLRSGPVLAVEGDKTFQSDWCAHAAHYGVRDVRAVRSIPMDRRHRSKVDSRKLKALLER